MLQLLGHVMLRGKRVTSKGWTRLTSKIGPIGYYKGKGVKNVGHHTSKGKIPGFTSTDQNLHCGKRIWRSDLFMSGCYLLTTLCVGYRWLPDIKPQETTLFRPGLDRLRGLQAFHLVHLLVKHCVTKALLFATFVTKKGLCPSECRERGGPTILNRYSAPTGFLFL